LVLSAGGLDGLTVELPHEVGDPQTGADVTALADDRPARGGLASVIETEDGGDIDPVPLGWHLLILAESFLASLLGSAPVIALADVPSVDLEHQGEGDAGGSFLRLCADADYAQLRLELGFFFW
jgi:hypothetical protein